MADSVRTQQEKTVNILTIPVTNNFPYAELKNYNYDLQEIRLDYSDSPDTDIERLRNFLPLDPITIVTLRDPAEGGKHPYPFRKKIELYQKLIERFDCMVDCEISLFQKHRPDLPLQNLILSRHIKPDADNVEKIVEKTIEQANKLQIRYLKIILPLTSYATLAKLKDWSELSKNPILIAGIGYLGKLSRILWKISGSAGTYTALKEFQTAEEQLTPEEYELYDCQFLDETTIFGGLIGAEQVYDSIGMMYYNQRLKRIDSRIVYLPFPVKDPEDFLAWLKELNKETRFFGFSVTMPFKRDIPRIMKITDRPVNLISVITDNRKQLPFGNEKFFYNTDREAIKRAFDLLMIRDNDPILIYGSGGVARAFLEEFSRLPNLSISGRNSEKVLKCRDNLKVDYLPQEKLQDKKFELIVNATPLGMKNEDFFTATGSNLPVKMIDLPYSERPTQTVITCQNNDIPCIDGKKFWLLQAKEQEEIFSQNIRKMIQ